MGWDLSHAKELAALLYSYSAREETFLVANAWLSFFSWAKITEIIVIKDIPDLICDTCSEIESTLEISRKADLIKEEFFAR